MTTLTLFNYRKNKWWAFKQMGLHRSHFLNVNGLMFYKMLGTGSSPGFSMYPDFSTYALLQTWTTKEDAETYFSSNEYFKKMVSKTSTLRTLFMIPFKSSGLWDGKNPFNVNNKLIHSGKIGVLTRATINFTKLTHFWRSVKSASNAISEASGVSFFKGVGELPFIQQATFSIWESEKDINDFAYSNTSHKNIVSKTKKQNWYKEDLFARFHILSDSDLVQHYE
jgi:heme-degrading monooxygenase HmoA